MVETTNFNPQHGFRGAWENLRVTERFAYVDANTIRYRFTIDDHYVDAVLVTGELPFRRLPGG